VKLIFDFKYNPNNPKHLGMLKDFSGMMLKSFDAEECSKFRGNSGSQLGVNITFLLDNMLDRELSITWRGT